MGSAMTSSDLIQKLKLFSPTQKATAKELGISPQYLGDILAGRREISDRVAKALGFRRVVTFERLK